MQNGNVVTLPPNEGEERKDERDGPIDNKQQIVREQQNEMNFAKLEDDDARLLKLQQSNLLDSVHTANFNNITPDGNLLVSFGSA